MAQPHAGCGRSGIAYRQHRRDDQPAAGGIAGDGDAARRHAVRQQEAIGGERIVDRRGERMLRREPIVDRQRARPRRAPDLGDEMPMAVERADDIAAAVQIQHGLAAIGIRRRCPFRLHAVGSDRFHRDIGRQFVLPAARVDVAAALGDVVGARPLGNHLHAGQRFPDRSSLVSPLFPGGRASICRSPATSHAGYRHPSQDRSASRPSPDSARPVPDRRSRRAGGCACATPSRW